GRCWRGRSRSRSRTVAGAAGGGIGGSRLGAAAAVAIAEVGHIPARTLQLKTGGSHLLCIGAFPAFGANRQDRVGHLLQDILGMATGAAFVSINRHENIPSK